MSEGSLLSRQRGLISWVYRMITGAHSNQAIATATTQPYLLGSYGLKLGHQIIASTSPASTSMELIDTHSFRNNHYHPGPGVYFGRDLVQITSPLLDTIVSRLGPDPPNEAPARDVLLQGLSASLATSGRESTLPLSYNSDDTSRKEVAWQAHRIGKALVGYAQEASKSENADLRLSLTSHCEGHLWTPAVASLLLGPRSHRDLMELYNEWLHRLILLRDALIPFENFEQVPIIIPASSTHGLRDFEDSRKVFLLQCLSSKIAQTAIVDQAKAVSAPALPRGGYGLQYSQGLILPAFLSGSASLHLLRYHPARLDESSVDLLFDYEYPIYRSLRSEISRPTGRLPPGAWPPPSLMEIDPRVKRSEIGISVGSDSSRRILRLELDIDTGVTAAVDVGQIARGLRYAYTIQSDRRKALESQDERLNRNPVDSNGVRASNPLQVSVDTCPTPEPSPPLAPQTFFEKAHFHEVAQVFTQPGLLSCSERGQIHVFPVSDPLVRLALLGKLFPENVILVDEDGDAPEKAAKTGKGFVTRFIVLQRRKGAELTEGNGDA